MAWTLHTSGSAIASAGANVNSTIVADSSTLALWSDEAEAFACNTARYDVITNYNNLTANGKQIFRGLCDAYVAQKIINYQPEAIGTIGAALRLNLLQTKIQEATSQIQEDKIKSYLKLNSSN